MKKRNFKILFLILVLISQIACMDKNIENNLTLSTINYDSDEGKLYKYQLNIPQIEKETSEDISYFNVTMKEEARYILENLTSEENDGKIKEAKISFENYENSFNTLSISVLTSVYTGGAHFINKLESYNFYLKDNTLLTLDKIFTEDGIEYFNMRINDIIAEKERVLNTQGREVIFFENAEADVRNSVILFEKDSVVFIFQNYDLSPYSSGMPVFKFNKKDIKKYLSI